MEICHLNFIIYVLFASKFVFTKIYMIYMYFGDTNQIVAVKSDQRLCIYTLLNVHINGMISESITLHIIFKYSHLNP
jgi:hypothetical protein